MREKIEAFYSLIPGGKPELEKSLGKDTLSDWTKEAKLKRPDLKPDELEGFVLKEHKSEIRTALLNKPGVDITALEKSLDSIIIPKLVKSVKIP